jgi:hypothetical protein
LPNGGPEQILEAYYSVALFSFAHFTADYPFIKNPAYNRDRGPVSVPAAAFAVLKHRAVPRHCEEHSGEAIWPKSADRRQVPSLRSQ